MYLTECHIYFFETIKKDGRIGCSHISLFVTLFNISELSEGLYRAEFYANEVMKLAKILSPSTYHKCLKELHDYGYIRYFPTKKKNKRSSAYLVC